MEKNLHEPATSTVELPGRNISRLEASASSEDSRSSFGLIDSLEHNPAAMESFQSLTRFCDINLDELLGTGAKSVVAIGRKIIAVKRMVYKMTDKTDKKCKQLAMQEIENMRIVKYHENILEYYDFKDDGNSIWIMTEHCNLGTLNEYVMTISLQPQQKLNFMIQITRGLKHMHSFMIPHCDVKPQNVLLTKEGDKYVVKLADLSGKEVIGTDFYMSPEVIQLKRGKMTSEYIDWFKADIFSLGILLYELMENKDHSGISFGETQLKAHDEGRKNLPKLYSVGDSSETIELNNNMTNFYGKRRSSISKVLEDLNKIDMRIKSAKLLDEESLSAFKEQIEKKIRRVMKDINYEDLSRQCHDRGVITSSDLEQLRCHQESNLLLSQKEYFFHIILNKESLAFSMFMDILKQTYPALHESLFAEGRATVALKDTHESLDVSDASTSQKENTDLSEERKHTLEKRRATVTMSKKTTLSAADVRDIKAHLIEVYRKNEIHIVQPLAGEKFILDVSNKDNMIPWDFTPNPENMDIIECLKLHNIVLCTALAGFGKSVLSRFLVEEFVKQSHRFMKQFDAVFYIPVKEVDINAKMSDILGCGENGLGYVQNESNRVSDDNVLLILDGIDQIPLKDENDLYKVITRKKYGTATVLLTSRPDAPILSKLSSHKYFNINGTTPEGVKDYLKRTLTLGPCKIPEKEVSQLFERFDNAVEFELKNPLHLTALRHDCAIHWDQKNTLSDYSLPNTHTKSCNTLLKIILRLWLERLGRTKNAIHLTYDRSPLDATSNLPSDIKRSLYFLGKISLWFVRQGQYTFTEQDLEFVDYNEIKTSGLFCFSQKGGHTVLSYHHKQLQEFMAAMYLCQEQQFKDISFSSQELFKDSSKMAYAQPEQKTLLDVFKQEKIASVMFFVFGLSPKFGKEILEMLKSKVCVLYKLPVFCQDKSNININYESQLCYEADDEDVNKVMCDILVSSQLREYDSDSDGDWSGHESLSSWQKRDKKRGKAYIHARVRKSMSECEWSVDEQDPWYISVKSQLREISSRTQIRNHRREISVRSQLRKYDSDEEYKSSLTAIHSLGKSLTKQQ